MLLPLKKVEFFFKDLKYLIERIIRIQQSKLREQYKELFIWIADNKNDY